MTTMPFLKKLVLAALACVPALAAAAYPERPITMYVSYSPGGGTDLVARAIAPYIEKYLGHGARIVVMNKPGAGGAIGFTQIANAVPDGYTIGFINTPNVITSPIERDAGFTLDRIDPLGNIVDDPDGFSVRAESPVKNLKDLAEAARKRPGEITVGTTGIGSDDHLAMLLFERIAKVKMNHIPMKGAADVRTAIQGGQIDVAAMNVGEAMQAIASGAPMRQLGSMSIRRTSLSPQLPTFAEEGYPIEMSSLRGIGAPRGLPPDVRAALVKAIGEAAHDPEFQQACVKYFAPLRYLDDKEFAAVLKKGDADFRQLWKEMPWAEGGKR
jgi:tripartite-type tricarboxylate transporter receptor subunit TctC